MAARTTRLRLIAAAAPAPAPAGAALATRRALWVFAPLTFLVLIALLLGSGEEERALRRLPPAERAALYDRTLENLQTVCVGDRGHELRDLCRGQAQLALLFPECDTACRATAREVLRTPTR